MHINISLLCLLVVVFSVQADEPYSIPRPTFEVYRPRGFRVSIPDSPGVRLFAFHGAVNRKLHGLENGDLSEDILVKTDGRWTYDNTLVKLEDGNTVNFWMFVIRGNLGYRIDDQRFIVSSSDIKEAPPGFFDDRSPPLRPTEKPNAYPTYVPPDPTSSNCKCDPQPIPAPLPPANAPAGHIPLTCYLPSNALGPIEVQSFESQTTTTTTPRPTRPMTTTFRPTEPPPDLGIWRDLLSNFSIENKEFRDRIRMLEQTNAILVKKLTSIGDENMNKLTLTGRIPKNGDPLELVQTVFKEKLNIKNISNIKSAVRTEDGAINFEMSTFDDKMHVLLMSNEKLNGTRFVISDITAVSFLDSSGRRMVDERMKELS